MENQAEKEKPVIKVDDSGAVATDGSKIDIRGKYAAGRDQYIFNQQPNKPSVYISYAPIDGEAVAVALRKLLKEREQDIVLVDHLDATVDKRDAMPRMILIVTPAALQSKEMRKDWQYARQEGVCIYLVKGAQGADLNIARLPKWMRKSHFFDLDNEKGNFLNCLKDPCYAVRAPYMAPRPPQKYVHRPEKFEQLLNHLQDVNPENPLPSTTVELYGPEGFGKTTLAECFCRHDTIINAYDGGILWVKMGENPNLEEEMIKLYYELTGESPKVVDKEGRFLKRKLEGKNCLLVIDDVWYEDHLTPLINCGNCACLITSPKFLFVNGAKQINIDEMTQDEAVKMLGAWLVNIPQNLEPLRNLAERCGRMPLMLGLVGAALHRHIEGGYTPDEAISHLNKSLDDKGVAAFDRYKTTECNKAITQTIEVNLKLLAPEQRDRYIQLAIFPEDTDIPLSVVSVLWGLQIFDTEELCEELNDLSLFKYDMHSMVIRLHKVFKSYLAGKVNDIAVIHASLANSLFAIWKKDKCKTKDDPTRDYALKYLFSHLVSARNWDDLKELLTDIEYLKAKQDPAQQYNFQKNFKTLLNDQQIPFNKLVDILEECLNVISVRLEFGIEKSDWLDHFSYCINEFGVTDKMERWTALKEVAGKFDHACAVVAKELANRFLKDGENDWALRFAELQTWVYQRAENYSKCVEACKFAEGICLSEGMHIAYQHLTRAEFIRMRARSLTKLCKTEAGLGMKEQYEAQARKAYADLNEAFSILQQNGWRPAEEEWKLLEEHSQELPTPHSMLDFDKKKSFKVKVLSNAHDCISAIHIIQFFEAYGGTVEWVHPRRFRAEELASHETDFIVLIGGPGAPGISGVEDRFYEKNKEFFLQFYDTKKLVASVLKTEQGKTNWYWVAGTSKINTIMAAYNLTNDNEVINRIKNLPLN